MRLPPHEQILKQSTEFNETVFEHHARRLLHFFFNFQPQQHKNRACKRLRWDRHNGRLLLRFLWKRSSKKCNNRSLMFIECEYKTACPMNLYTRPIVSFRFEDDKYRTSAARKVQF